VILVGGAIGPTASQNKERRITMHPIAVSLHVFRTLAIFEEVMYILIETCIYES
jgi:hypothetical protein